MKSRRIGELAMVEAEIIKDTAHESDLTVALIPSSEDPPKRSKHYQDELSSIAKEVHGQGIDFSSRAVFMESATGGGFALGEFYAIVKTVSPALAGLIGPWLQKKYGRKERPDMNGNLWVPDRRFN